MRHTIAVAAMVAALGSGGGNLTVAAQEAGDGIAEPLDAIELEQALGESGAEQDGLVDEVVLLDEADLDDLVAPVALYPDALLAQVLVAATYPLQVVKADRFLEANAEMSETERSEAVQAADWDPSVQVLAAGFPTVVERMADELEWTEDLGFAMLQQDQDVLDAVQRMRARAEDTGYLTSNEAQVVENDGEQITIAPADPEVIYVPNYDSSAAFTSAPTAPAYIAAPQSGGSWLSNPVTAGAIGFGASLLISELFGDDADNDDNDNDWNGYWRRPRPIDWRDRQFYPRPYRYADRHRWDDGGDWRSDDWRRVHRERLWRAEIERRRSERDWREYRERVERRAEEDRLNWKERRDRIERRNDLTEREKRRERIERRAKEEDLAERAARRERAEQKQRSAKEQAAEEAEQRERVARRAEEKKQRAKAQAAAEEKQRRRAKAQAADEEKQQRAKAQAAAEEKRRRAKAQAAAEEKRRRAKAQTAAEEKQQRRAQEQRAQAEKAARQERVQRRAEQEQPPKQAAEDETEPRKKKKKLPEDEESQ